MATHESIPMDRPRGHIQALLLAQRVDNRATVEQKITVLGRARKPDKKLGIACECDA